MSYVIAEILVALVLSSLLAGIIGWVARDFVVRWELGASEPGTDLERRLQEQMELNMQLRDDLDTARMRLRDLDGQLAAREPERQALEAELTRRANTIKALEKGIENGRAQLALSNDALTRLRTEVQTTQDQLETARVKLATVEERSRQPTPPPPMSRVAAGGRAAPPPPPARPAPWHASPARISAPREVGVAAVVARGNDPALLDHEPIEALEAPDPSEEIVLPPVQVAVHVGRHASDPSPGSMRALDRPGSGGTDGAASAVGDLIEAFRGEEDPADMVTAEVEIELPGAEADYEQGYAYSADHADRGADDVEVLFDEGDFEDDTARFDGLMAPTADPPPPPPPMPDMPALVEMPEAPVELASAPPVPRAAAEPASAASGPPVDVPPPLPDPQADTPAAAAVVAPLAPPPPVGDLTREQARQRIRGFVAQLAAAVGDASDDLQQIKGIGPKTSTTLGVLGVTTYRHLASLPDSEIDVMAKAIRYSAAKIRRSDWAGQARRLHQLKTGEQLG